MPKVVDPDERRRVVVDALFAVVRREGMAGASVRAVAAEAGLSPGAMRHYVGSQGELVELATRAVADRVAARIGHLSLEGPDDLVDLLAEVVPVDDERRAETEVWLAMVAESRTDPRLVPLAEETHDGLRRIAALVVRAVAPGLSPAVAEVETDRLHALVDGLAVHGVLYPRALTPDRARAVLRAHVHQLATRR